MKKYFIAETDEELEFGETIELDLTKKTRHGKHKVEGEIEFSEHSLPLLLEIGAVEEREDEDDDAPLLDYDVDCEALENLMEDFEALEKKVECLENRQTEFIKTINRLIDCWKETLHEAVKEAQPKKK